MKDHVQDKSRGPAMDDMNRMIQQAKRELEDMIDLNPQIMLLADRDGTVMRTNRALLEFLGLASFQEVIGKQLSHLFRCEDALFFSRLLKDQSGYQARETEVDLPDRRKHILRFLVVGSGTERELSGIVIQDITGEKERSAHLEKQHKKEAVQALMGALMHNVNQSLTVIMLRAHLIHLALEKSTIQPGELKESLQDIMDLTTQIADMLKHVEKPRDYITQPYIEGVDILDIERSSWTEEPAASSTALTPREKFIAALERQPVTGRVPHFELVFFLTMEAFGKLHPSHRNYHQWQQMEEKERQLQREDMADLYIAIAERFEHSAIFLSSNPDSLDETLRLIDLVRDKTGDRYFLMLHGDATFSIPGGNSMTDFSCRLVDEPAKVKEEAASMVWNALDRAEKIQQHGGLDGFALCADYCFNEGPFLSPSQFGEFVTPYLAKLIQGYRDMRFYSIKHTDGNIMPILDQLVEANPHALHSLDPQAGVDIAEVKKRYGDRICLIGNVNCGLIDTGTDKEIIESARYALKHGMPGGGYVFSTSNCVYTGMKLSRYELILDVWRREGNY